MRSKRVVRSTLTKSSSLSLTACFLQYSITVARILLVTFRSRIALLARLSLIMRLILRLIFRDSVATATSRSKVSLSELLRVSPVLMLYLSKIFSRDFSLIETYISQISAGDISLVMSTTVWQAKSNRHLICR